MWYQKLDFWKGLSLIGAGVSVVLYVFGKIDASQVLSSEAILGVILGLLHWLNINPTVKRILGLVD